jgi:hypothetical protein
MSERYSVDGWGLLISRQMGIINVQTSGTNTSVRPRLLLSTDFEPIKGFS